MKPVKTNGEVSLSGAFVVFTELKLKSQSRYKLLQIPSIVDELKGNIMHEPSGLRV
jgi:hypothetical protein